MLANVGSIAVAELILLGASWYILGRRILYPGRR